MRNGLNQLRPTAISLVLVLFLVSPLQAASKYSMPDLSQDENTCFPTAASNLIYWFGKNGYPQLIPTVAEGEDPHHKLFAQLLIRCNVSYKLGTEFNLMTSGLANFFRDRGCNNVAITYRGFGSRTYFSDPNWLDKNDRDNTGFILCIDYVEKKGDREYVSNEPLGHCLTLVSYSDNTAVILDPAHRPEERSRFTLRFIPKPNATLRDSRGSYQLPLVYELSGASVGYESAEVAILTGAICIEMPTTSVPTPPAQAVGQKP